MQPKKSLGQNFLTSIPARIEIVKAGNVEKTDRILEIGPGRGFLTEEILKTGANVIAVEKDRNLIELLKQKFNTEITKGQLTLINEDILEFDPSVHHLSPGTYKLVANIPYYITGAIIRKFLSDAPSPATMVLLLQKEVAERIVARDGKESILSLSVKAYGDPKIPYRVKRGSFNPIPNVDSAVLLIENIRRTNFTSKKQEEIYFELVKAGFAHKRKLLISNLREIFSSVDLVSLFKDLEINDKVRAEDLSLANWLSLSREIKK
jgi:16S rRNA (adenine1518-N6/adenine1519-N6)-dimethyltransferase